jgi:hypothetical protein
MAKHLVLIERTSLGRKPAQRVRQESAAADIAEVLRRSTPEGTGTQDPFFRGVEDADRSS